MSLQVWMPLIKDYENYGLSNLRFANFRYIRFVVNAIKGGSDAYTQLSRLEFIDAEGNLYKYPAGTTVSTSMTGYPASEPPASIIDGNVNTKFCAPYGGAGNHLTIAIGGSETIDISRYSRFQWYTANDGEWRDPISFEVQFSNDGVNFVKGAVVTNASITSTRYALAYTGKCFNASAGKIGSSCYYNASYDTGGLVSNTKINLGNKLSMCCWVKFSSLLSDSALGASMGGQHRYPNCTGMGLTIKYISSSTGYLSCNTGDGSNRTYNTYCGNTLLSAGTWYHVVFTYDGSNIRFYVNGKFDGSYSYAAQKNVEDYVFLGAWSFEHSTDSSTMYGHYKLNGCINDFRIYDHVLSIKEIKEISRGIVAHYQLKPTNIANYAKNTPFSIYNNYGVGATLTQLNEQFMGYPVYRLTMTPTSANVSGFQTELWSHGVTQGSWTFSANTKYCYWLYYRPVSHNDIRAGGVASNVGGWTEIAPQYVEDGWYRVGQYRDGSTTSTKTDNIYTSFRTPSAAANVPITVDFCAPHLIGGLSEIIETYDAVVPEDNKVHDVSGYDNDLDIVGSLAVSESSPRYGSSIDFNQTGYLKKTDFNMTTNEFTIAFWLNPPYSINAQHFICGTFNSWTGNGFGMWRDSTGGGYSLLYKSNSEGSHTGFPAITPTHDTWSHIAIVYTGRQGILYKNGVEVARVDGGSSGTVFHPVLYLGNSRYSEVASQTDEAAMSDFRFYATALSASDIEGLYKHSASITKAGILFAYDFNEFNPNAKSGVDKYGTASSCSLNTKVVPTADMKMKTLEDGSTWARIHRLDLTTDKTLFANAAEVAKCSRHNRFSRMCDVDKFKSQPSLPSGYTEIEYIQSSGTQYINTGIAPTSDMKVEISYIPTDRFTEHSIFGSSWAVDGFFLMIFQGKIRFHSGGSVVDAASCSAGNRYIIECTNSYIKINGTSYGISGGANTAGNILLLGDMGYNASCRGVGKIEYAKIWADGKLARNFVPCKNASGTVGLYDLVEDKFYANAGSGSFTAGTFVSKYEFMLTYPALSSTEYNRWTQTSSPNATSVTGYVPIHIAWPAHSAGIRKHGSASIYDCDSGDTWYAPIGQTSIWEGGIPAANGNMQLQTELWVRADKSAEATQTKIYDGTLVASNFIEL